MSPLLQSSLRHYLNVLGRVPVTRRKAVARMLEAIHAQESREACGRKAEEVAGELESMRLGAAARTVPRTAKSICERILTVVSGMLV